MKIKNIIVIFIKRLLRCSYYLYSYHLNERILLYRDIIYGLWISNVFNTVGKIFISCPIYIKGGEYISIGSNCGFGKRMRIEAWDKYNNEKFTPEILIGNNVSFSHDCHIGAINKIVIGDNVLIGSKVFISDHSHGKVNDSDISIPPIKRNLYSKGPIIIEDNVWIGEAVTILANVVIGKNSIIASNSVVTKSIPENSLVGGVPSKIIKKI